MRALSNWMGPFDTPTIARYASDVITKTNWDKQNRMVEDLTLLQVHEQVFLKQVLEIAPRSINKKFGSILSGIIRPEAQQIPLELQNCVSFKKSCCT